MKPASNLHCRAPLFLAVFGALFLGTRSVKADTLYIASPPRHYVQKVDTSGDGSVFAADPGGGFGSIANPWGLALDSSGNLYIANANGNDIVKVSSSGSISIFATTGLDNPYGMAFDKNGNLYVANYGNSTIEKITPAESVLYSPARE